MAQVLNTLAHEIRTPLAVSQGYLKLYVDGRLTTPDDQQRALQRTREALGVIAVLCSEMSKVSALAEASDVVLAERVDLSTLARDLAASNELSGAVWSAVPASPARVATNAPRDLTHAIAVVCKAAFDEDKRAPHHLAVSASDDAIVIRAGTEEAVRALPSTPDGPGATAVNMVRGGKGLSLIWASFVFGQHRIQTWNHQDHKASTGLRIPLVTV